MTVEASWEVRLPHSPSTAGSGLCEGRGGTLAAAAAGLSCLGWVGNWPPCLALRAHSPRRWYAFDRPTAVMPRVRARAGARGLSLAMAAPGRRPRSRPARPWTPGAAIGAEKVKSWEAPRAARRLVAHPAASASFLFFCFCSLVGRPAHVPPAHVRGGGRAASSSPRGVRRTCSRGTCRGGGVAASSFWRGVRRTCGGEPGGGCTCFLFWRGRPAHVPPAHVPGGAAAAPSVSVPGGAAAAPSVSVGVRRKCPRRTCGGPAGGCCCCLFLLHGCLSICGNTWTDALHAAHF